MGPDVMTNSPAYRRAPLGLVPGQPTSRLNDFAVEAMGTLDCGRRTDQTCIQRIRRLVRFHSLDHPEKLTLSCLSRFWRYLVMLTGKGSMEAGPSRSSAHGTASGEDHAGQGR